MNTFNQGVRDVCSVAKTRPCCTFIALTWQVIGSLIDLDCSEDFIKTLLQNVWKPKTERPQQNLIFDSIFLHIFGSFVAPCAFFPCAFFPRGNERWLCT